jgi:predicted RNase H-like HicB family nuclease
MTELGSSFGDAFTALVHPDSNVIELQDVVVAVRTLDQLPQQDYRLVRPLALTVHYTGDGYWVGPDEFVLYGAGATVDEAMEEYAYALVDYYEDLQEQREHLAPHLLQHLAYLETIIARS